ncbi:MAG: hypothetical protein M1837_006993 [Sclerophora amabilis]|nr:MAG: hypothetical protein M1837_006993 [Sclerophora amabilis]
MPAMKIAIIGAGPAGCMLARLLHRANVPVTIFEREASIDCRSQGGTLDLHTDTGLAAMQEAGLYEEFLKLARFDGEAFAVADKKLTVYLRAPGSTTKSTRGRPEIDRWQLRSLLADSIPKDIIRWNHRLRKIGPNNELHFDGTIETGFDLIIGADGAWSQTRRLLSQEEPFYSGVAGHSLSIPNAAERAPTTYKLVNRGSLFAFSDGRSIMGQQMGDGSISVSTWSARGEDWMEQCGYDPYDGAASKEAMRREYHDWTPKLLNLTQEADDNVTPRSLYMLRVGYRWDHRPGVTLLGDAAHLMTPFAGEGVNLAFEDARKLAHAIIIIISSAGASSQDGAGGTEALAAAALAANIKAYEEDMFQRATSAQQLTYGMMQDTLFTAGAPRTVIESWILRVARHAIHPVLYPFVAAAVYVFYFFFKLVR